MQASCQSLSLRDIERHAVNTSSKLDLALTEVRLHRRARQVLESRPMTLDALPLSPGRATDNRAHQVLTSQRASLQRSLF